MKENARKFPEFEPIDPGYLRLLKSMTPHQKFVIANELRELARDILYLSIKNSHPEWDKTEILTELSWRMTRKSVPREIFIEHYKNARKQTS